MASRSFSETPAVEASRLPLRGPRHATDNKNKRPRDHAGRRGRFSARTAPGFRDRHTRRHTLRELGILQGCWHVKRGTGRRATQGGTPPRYAARPVSLDVATASSQASGLRLCQECVRRRPILLGLRIHHTDPGRLPVGKDQTRVRFLRVHARHLHRRACRRSTRPSATNTFACSV